MFFGDVFISIEAFEELNLLSTLSLGMNFISATIRRFNNLLICKHHAVGARWGFSHPNHTRILHNVFAQRFLVTWME